LDNAGEKEKRTSRKKVDGRSTSSPDNKKFRTRSMKKQKGLAFGFRKKETDVKKKDRKVDTLEQATTAHRGNTSIALHFL